MNTPKAKEILKEIDAKGEYLLKLPLSGCFIKAYKNRDSFYFTVVLVEGVHVYGPYLTIGALRFFLKKEVSEHL